MHKQKIITVHCPKAKGIYFATMREIVDKAARSAFECKGVPLAILSSELTLRYRFEVTHDYAHDQARRMQARLPDGVAVAFNVFQMGDGKNADYPANMGYFFTNGEFFFQPKRDYSNGDVNHLIEFYGMDKFLIPFSNWALRGRHLMKNDKKFPSIMLGGQEIEYRVCSDLISHPFSKNDSITLVSADGVWHEDFELLSKFRAAAIANDCDLAVNPDPLVGTRRRMRAEITQDNEFMRVDLYK